MQDEKCGVPYIYVHISILFSSLVSSLNSLLSEEVIAYPLNTYVIKINISFFVNSNG